MDCFELLDQILLQPYLQGCPHLRRAYKEQENNPFSKTYLNLPCTSSDPKFHRKLLISMFALHVVKCACRNKTDPFSQGKRSKGKWKQQSSADNFCPSVDKNITRRCKTLNFHASRQLAFPYFSI